MVAALLIFRRDIDALLAAKPKLPVAQHCAHDAALVVLLQEKSSVDKSLVSPDRSALR